MNPIHKNQFEPMVYGAWLTCRMSRLATQTYENFSDIYHHIPLASHR